MWRDSTWYQAQAVAASPPVSMIVNVTAGPNRRVTGTSGTVRPSRPVLAIRFTPFGAFIWGVNSGLSPRNGSRSTLAESTSAPRASRDANHHPYPDQLAYSTLKTKCKNSSTAASAASRDTYGISARAVSLL